MKEENLSEGAKQLIEDLAELEHKQWCHIIGFLQSLSSDELIKKIYVDYKFLMGDYKDLSEEEKEKDRIWARKVLRVEFESAEKELNRIRKGK